MNASSIYKAAFFCLIFFAAIIARAQEKQLRGVTVQQRKRNADTVSDRRLQFSPGTHVLLFDSALLQQYSNGQLAKLLAEQSPAFVRSYGVNGLATLNFRGSSSAQSQVFWNGIPMNNAATGISDISLPGVGSFDKVNVAFGSSAALWGSGNVGAAVLLENTFRSLDTQTFSGNAQIALGSFGEKRTSTLLRMKVNASQFSLRGQLASTENDFTYKNLNAAAKRLSNADLRSGSSVFTFSRNVGKTATLEGAVWYLQSGRGIPPALFESFSAKRQNDEALRSMLHFKKKLGRHAEWFLKGGYFAEELQFDDSTIALHTRMRSSQIYGEAGIRYAKGKHALLVFAPLQWAALNAMNDTQSHSQQRVGLAVAYTFSLRDRFSVAVNARAENIDTKNVFVSGLNARFKLLSFLSLKANVQQTYRAPTLSERFNMPGGNPDLKPEQGFGADGGWQLHFALNDALHFEHEASFFLRQIDDWIIWFGGSIWTPHNIARVVSKGAETFNMLRWQGAKHAHKVSLQTSVLRAETVRSVIPGDGTIGKQIPYAPRVNVRAGYEFERRRFSAGAYFVYTGYRFVTADESQWLQPYSVCNAFVNYRFAKPRIICSFSINNVLDNRYQVVAFRPMPGRNALLSLRFEW